MEYEEDWEGVWARVFVWEVLLWWCKSGVDCVDIYCD
jgi:hypothetical protein